ncbi:MAG: hypothetical protein QOE71_2490 [Pseudonocardiales bacterium]|nr:hypothetical protein [Pseudonocardiales bacterium]
MLRGGPVSIPVLTAADGAVWESELLAELERSAQSIEIVRRCVDVVDLLAVAGAGIAVAAIVDAQLRRFDADAVDRLAANGVAVIGVISSSAAAGDPSADEERLRSVGVGHLLPSTAGADVLLSVLESAISDAAAPAAPRAFADPAFATGQLSTPSSGTGVGGLDDAASGGPAPRRGSVVAVWGPTGAPGRTTIAVTLADELARLPLPTLLVDADVYGGVVSSVLGLLDESPGVAAACRQAQSRSLDQAALAALAWQISPTFRVLTGLPRADRWPELRTTAIEEVLGVARQLAEFTVVDLGFALESDEELSFDTLAPRRNGATLAVLDNADLVLAVASADPVGIQRLIRGLSELREAEVSAPVWIVLNRVRKGPIPGDPNAELNAALQRFAGRSAAALLPYDRAGLDTALARGKSLAEASPTSPLRRAVTELAVDIAGAQAPVRGRRRR